MGSIKNVESIRKIALEFNYRDALLWYGIKSVEVKDQRLASFFTKYTYGLRSNNGVSPFYRFYTTDNEEEKSESPLNPYSEHSDHQYPLTTKRTLEKPAADDQRDVQTTGNDANMI